MLNRVKNYNKNETERLADNARNLEILIQKFIWRRKIFKKKEDIDIVICLKNRNKNLYQKTISKKLSWS